MSKDFLSPNEAAEQAGVTNSTIRNWCKNGLGVKVGGQWRIGTKELSDFLKGVKYEKNS